MKKTIWLSIITAWASVACAQFPGVLPFEIETTKYVPQDIQLRRGETKVLQFHFLQDGAAISIPGTATVLLNYKAINEAGSYNVATGYVYSATGGYVRLLWTSALNPTNRVSQYDVTVNTSTATMCRAFGRLNLDSQVSVGSATGNPGRVTLIDWQTVINSNLGAAPFTDGAGYIPTGSVDGTTIAWDGQLHAIAAAAPDLVARAAIIAETNRAQIAEAALYPRNNPSGYVDRVAATSGMQIAGTYLTPLSALNGSNLTASTVSSNAFNSALLTELGKIGTGGGADPNAVTNGAATVSGNAISNGAAIVLTAADVGALGLSGGNLTGSLYIQKTFSIGVWDNLTDAYYADALYWASGNVGVVTHYLLNEFDIPPNMSGEGIRSGTIPSNSIATATDTAYRNLATNTIGASGSGLYALTNNAGTIEWTPFTPGSGSTGGITAGDATNIANAATAQWATNPATATINAGTNLIVTTDGIRASKYWYGTNAYEYYNGTGVVLVIP